MGCLHSNSETNHTSVEDNGNQDFAKVPKLKPIDDRLPLNARQVFRLKQSWKGVRRKIEEAGVEMFIR